MAPPAAQQPGGSASSSWRTPSAAVQEKHNLNALPENFEPTQQEQGLLDMYETIRMYEKEAARIKEEAARAKLDAAAAKYEQSQKEEEPKKKKRRKKKSVADGEVVMGDAGESEEYESEDEEPTSLAERREAKLAELREELEEAKLKADTGRAAAAEEALRAQLLETKEDDMDLGGVSLKRKRQEVGDEKTSLITNLKNQATPPHEFSQKLGLKSWEGKTLFPVSKDTPMWTPSLSASNPTDGDLSFELSDFDVTQGVTAKGSNTIAIKYMAPTDSKRFSMNITTPDQKGQYDSVLFHFNPRQFEKGGQLVLNNKQTGLWGQNISVPLSRVPKIFGQQSCTLMIQINEEGFDVYIEDIHCARLEHREVLPTGKSNLVLQFPATDDYGAPENWTVYKVWWGHKEIMAKEDLTDVYGVNAFSGVHPKKLFIKGLPRVSTQAEVDLRKAELERAFRKYGGDLGVTVIAPVNVTFAFVECASEQQANLALEEMANSYDIKRARRTRYEALQEERAAAEAEKVGNKKESTEWD